MDTRQLEKGIIDFAGVLTVILIVGKYTGKIDLEIEKAILPFLGVAGAYMLTSLLAAFRLVYLLIFDYYLMAKNNKIPLIIPEEVNENEKEFLDHFPELKDRKALQKKLSKQAEEILKEYEEGDDE
ncbi:MAG: hypothetical protein F6K19_01765 [Cyanothece sp. SIO1E1]|nr:hypothetical protein [Cyanothece sp. SIO1E1]